MSLVVIFLVFTVATALADALLAVYSLPQKNGGRWLSMVCAGACVTEISYLLSVLPVSYLWTSLFSSVYFVSIDVMLWCLLGFVLVNTRQGAQKALRLLHRFLGVWAVVDMITLLANPFCEIAVSYAYRGTMIAPYEFQMKPLYYAHLALTYLMVLVSLILFIAKAIRTPRTYRRQHLLNVLAIVLVVAFNACFLFIRDKSVLQYLDYSIWGYSFAAFFIFWNAFKYSRHGMLKYFRGWIFDSIGQAIVLFDYENNHIMHNARAAELFKHQLDMTDDFTMEEFVHACALPVTPENVGENVSFQACLPESENALPIQCDLRVLKDDNGAVMGHLFVLTDTSDERDMLTGFHNWESFLRTLSDRTRPYNSTPVLVAACDINGLQEINDARGRSIGDRAIQLLADSMRETFPAGTYFVRGREATLLALCYGGEEDGIRPCVESVNRSLGGQNTLGCFVSIQYALSPAQGLNLEHAIREAFRGLRTKKMMDRRSGHAELLNGLIRTQQENDHDTEAHVLRTQKLGSELGRRIGLSDVQRSDLALLCILHDIGKIGVPLEILNKPGKLSSEEWKVLQAHVEKGYQICCASQELHSIADMVRHHHERWDGKGYPDGLSGESIPLLARVISVVDSYDAMVNNRPYRRAMSREQAMAELRRCAGTQFDPNIVNAFLELLEDLPEELREAAEGAQEAAPVWPDFAVLTQPARLPGEEHVRRVTYARYITDAEMSIVFADDGFETITGYTAEDVQRGLRHTDLLCMEDRAEYLCQLSEQLANNRAMALLEHRIRRKDGTIRYVFCYGRNFYDSANRDERTEIIVLDSADSHQVRSLLADEYDRGVHMERMEHKNGEDNLTGLMKYEAFRADVDMNLLRGDLCCLLIMMDIDGFRAYNEQNGTAGSVSLLTSAARAINGSLRKGDLACRVANDEFAAALFFDADENRELLVRRAREICGRINKELSPEGSTITMGMAFSDAEIITFSQLRHCAETALRTAKSESSPGSVLLYTKDEA